MKSRAAEPNQRWVVSPEGVSLPFELGSITDRVTAFGIDFLISQLTALVIVVIGFVGGGMGVGVPLGLVASFLIRNFYFAFFEIRWNGSTPGKRRYNLRVISRDGGPVTAEAIFARNLTRDIEVFYPLIALSAPDSVVGGLPGWATAIAVVWLLTLAAFPFFSRDRLRIGDLLAGTLVVRMPETKLEPDLADLSEKSRDPLAEPIFTQEQLDLYGIKELQVLEDILRRNRTQRDRHLVKEIAKRIRTKIGWIDDGSLSDWQFLNAFYGAQRGRLEGKMLFGKRQQEKRR